MSDSVFGSEYVSRGAWKLKSALEHFKVIVKRKIVADFGCSTGGFTEILLEAGASKVYAVDTAYGQLAWKLRQDQRVVVLERTNALHLNLPEKVDIITIDVGWTSQKKILPIALKNLKTKGQIISLVKPHYEANGFGVRFKGKGLAPDEAKKVLGAVIAGLTKENINVSDCLESPIFGGKGKNIEYLIIINQDEPREKQTSQKTKKTEPN